jgi:phage replication-related protein YjqB (UPF0714/DUF867 family)
MAIHGGDLELMTDTIASAAARQGGASYYGVVHPVGLDRHLASARYRREESAGLAAFLDHVDVVVSIHGYGRDGMWTTLLAGGNNRELAEHLGAELAERLPGYEVVDDLERIPAELRGANPSNPVNAPPSGGVQLELPPRVRGSSPFSPPPGPDGFSPPTRALIDGLAEVAATWLDRESAA